MPRKHHDPQAAFWSHVDMTGGPDACWPWMLGIGDDGYGHVGWWEGGAKVKLRAHQAAFLFATGRRLRGTGPDDLLIRHTCDHKPCCNPAHLIEGTPAQNVADAVERGRHSPPPRYEGEAHTRAKLTARRVRVARRAHRMGCTCSALARRYGVGETTMGHALAGRTWRDA